MQTRTVLIAEEGMMLTNGSKSGRVVYLAVGADASAFREVPAEEDSEITMKAGDEI